MLKFFSADLRERFQPFLFVLQLTYCLSLLFLAVILAGSYWRTSASLWAEPV
jgi:hypothetical protein